MMLKKQQLTLQIKQNWTKQRVLLSSIMLLAVGLGQYRIGEESLWIDELYSVYDARGLPATLTLERPFYYIALRAWMLLGSDVSWMRALSALFGLGSVFLVHRLGRRVGGEAVGLVAALLVAVSPLFINFAQMVRMYSMALCLGLSGSLALMQALEQPTWLTTGWWAAARILMIGTTPLTASLLLPDLLLIGWTFRRQPRQLWLFAKSFLLIFLWFIPVLWITVTSRTSLLGSESAATEDVSFSIAAVGATLKIIFGKLRKFAAFPFPTPSQAVSLFYQIYTLMLWCLVSIGLLRWHRFPKIVWVALWGVLPSVVNFLASPGLFETDRYIVFVLPYFLILLAAGFVALWQERRSLAIAAALLYIPAVGGGLFRYYTVQDRQDWQGIMHSISTSEQAGDRIIVAVHNPGKAPLVMKYYYHGNNLISGLASGTCRSDPSSLTTLTPTPSRIWLICGSDIDESRLQGQLQRQFDIASHQKFINWGFDRQNDYLHVFLLVRHQNN
jgi:mannosyltransferase